MRKAIKNFIRAITPPVVLRAGKAVFLSQKDKQDVPKEETKKHQKTAKKPKPALRKKQEAKGEKGAEWYDKSFENHAHWKKHYSLSKYYFLWTVISDRILRAGHQSILEVGCGTGQLASLIRDNGVISYHGFDFSSKRIEQAKKNCPKSCFSLQDAFKTDLFDSFEYTAVICTEFLEHVEGDLTVLKRIKAGTRFYGTVPNFPYTSHVRHFKNSDEVYERYKDCFSDLRVDSFLANDKGKTYFLLEGSIV